MTRLMISASSSSAIEDGGGGGGDEDGVGMRPSTCLHLHVWGGLAARPHRGLGGRPTKRYRRLGRSQLGLAARSRLI